MVWDKAISCGPRIENKQIFASSEKEEIKTLRTHKKSNIISCSLRVPHKNLFPGSIIWLSYTSVISTNKNPLFLNLFMCSRMCTTKGKLCVVTLRDFLPEGVTLCKLLSEVQCSDFSWNAIPCVVWILPFKFSFFQKN